MYLWRNVWSCTFSTDVLNILLLSSKSTLASQVVQLVKNSPTMKEVLVQFLGWGDPLEKGTATHSSILAWRITWTEETGALQSAKSWIWLSNFHFQEHSAYIQDAVCYEANDLSFFKILCLCFTVWNGAICSTKVVILMNSILYIFCKQNHILWCVIFLHKKKENLPFFLKIYVLQVHTVIYPNHNQDIQKSFITTINSLGLSLIYFLSLNFCFLRISCKWNHIK